jgi:hypothetical protein
MRSCSRRRRRGSSAGGSKYGEGGGGSAIGVDDGLGEGEGICGVLRRENGGGRGKGCGGIERCLLNGAAEGRGRRGV